MFNRRWAVFVLFAVIFVGSSPLSAAPSVDVARATGAPLTATAVRDSTAVLSGVQEQIASLKGARDPEVAKRLIDLLLQAAQPDGYAPAAMKRYVIAELPAALLLVARNAEFQVNLRASALMALRVIDANDSDIDAGVRVARSDTSAGRDYLASRAELLTQWQQSRARTVRQSNALQPTNTAAEAVALAHLKSAGIRVSAEAMWSEVAEGNVPAVEALLDAGVSITAHSGLSPDIDVWSYATSVSCVAATQRNPTAQAAVLSLLLSRGANPNRRDDSNETPLHSAARYCPLAMVRQLVGVGGDVNAKNNNDFTALSYALILGRWDVAEYLVASGARLTKPAIEALFFELPLDPAQRQIIRRAQRDQ